MSTDLLYTILGICAVLVSACIVFLTYHFSQTLKRINNTLSVIQDTANDVNMVRRGVKATVISAINSFINSQGGDSK